MTFNLLKNQNFRNYFLADITSGFGSGMNFIGAGWFILEITGSNRSVGFLLALTLFSGLVVFPFSGMIVDRFNRRQIIWWSNLARGILIAIVAVSIITSSFKVIYLYFLVIIGGAGWSIFIPASRGLIQELVEKDELINGNSFIEISMQVGMFTAAAASGIIFRYFGFATILLIDTATFLISNYFLAKIRYDAVITHDQHESPYKQFSNGLKFLSKNPLIFGFGIMMFLPFVATMTSNVVLPGYVKNYLHQNSVIYGLADMSYGIGACLSGSMAASLATRFTRNKVVLLCFIVSIISLIFLIFNQYIIGLYIASVIFGLCNSSLRILLQTTAMEITPKEFFGRVMSVWVAISMTIQIISSYGAGCLMDNLRPNLGFLLLASIMVIGLSGVLYFKVPIRSKQE